jgi:hypothetical protein
VAKDMNMASQICTYPREIAPHFFSTPPCLRNPFLLSFAHAQQEVLLRHWILLIAFSNHSFGHEIPWISSKVAKIERKQLAKRSFLKNPKN